MLGQKSPWEEWNEGDRTRDTCTDGIYDAGETDYMRLRAFTKVPVDLESEAGAQIAQQLCESMPGVRISSVHQIRHPLLWKRFVARRGELAGLHRDAKLANVWGT